MKNGSGEIRFRFGKPFLQLGNRMADRVNAGVKLQCRFRRKHRLQYSDYL